MCFFTGSFETIRNAKYFFFARRSTIKLGVKQVRVFARACASFPIASLIFKFPGTSRFSLSLCSFFSTLALPTSGSQLRKSVQTRLRFSSVIKERAARRIAAKPSSSPSLPYSLSLSTVIRPFNVPIRRVYIFNWSLKFTLVTPVVAAEAISCANKLRWIKLYGGAWMKFIVWVLSLLHPLPLDPSAVLSPSPVSRLSSSSFLRPTPWRILAKRSPFKDAFPCGFTFFACARHDDRLLRFYVIFIEETCWLQPRWKRRPATRGALSVTYLNYGKERAI